MLTNVQIYSDFVLFNLHIIFEYINMVNPQFLFLNSILNNSASTTLPSQQSLLHFKYI